MDQNENAYISCKGENGRKRIKMKTMTENMVAAHRVQLALQ